MIHFHQGRALNIVLPPPNTMLGSDLYNSSFNLKIVKFVSFVLLEIIFIKVFQRSIYLDKYFRIYLP